MLQLKNIVKQYRTGDETVDALRGVNIDFRENEFVSVLGPSGCGKTTLLNIIGGLDGYTEGDLIIDGRSTKEFTDRDWDTYRNHKVGFVFQSYNLIAHQSVLSNVELALTLSGVSKSERRKRAVEALEKVGLKDQIHKKPNQMSGGQMQRVAIARALVNDPQILLADEPTGALDSATSVQIMDLLKEIARDRLVIMVTHNPELAEQYSTRIVRFLDGKMTDDTSPFKYDPPKKAEEKVLTRTQKKALKKEEKKTSMSFFTALSLSLNNLMTKKARTILTSFAGSIGIIGIALILSISSGLQLYINRVQEDTLSSYPITIQAETPDISAIIASLSEKTEANSAHELDKIYSNIIMYDMMNSMINAETKKNNLKDFKVFLDSHLENDAITSIIYGYNTELHIYSSDTENIRKLNPSTLMNSIYGNSAASNPMMSMGSFKIWSEMLSGKNGELVNDLVKEQYDVVDGRWPEKYNEVVLVADKNNEISDLVLCMLGFKSEEEMNDIINSALAGKEIVSKQESWEYSEILSTKFKLVLPTDYYQYNEQTGAWVDMSENDKYMSYILSRAEDIEIVGIVRPNEDAVAASITGSVGYTYALTDHIAEKINASEILKAQKADPSTDIFTALPFKTDDYVEPTDAEKAAAAKEYIASLSESKKAVLYEAIAVEMPASDLEAAVNASLANFPTREAMEEVIVGAYAAEMGMPEETVRSYLADMSDEQIKDAIVQMIEMQVKAQYKEKVSAALSSMSVAELAAMLDMYVAAASDATLAPIYDAYLPASFSESTYDANISKLGVFDIDNPANVSIYSSSFEAKDEIAALIDEYNAGVALEDEITYTDYIALMMSSITTIINAISYILIAFVSISLVVSSIMIGIITYISVLERTKEIGVLRAIGASKRDVGRVFNAETMLVGFASGMFGIIITLLLNIPINMIIEALSGIGGIAKLPVGGAVILVLISIALTLIAGLIPSRIAAKKDPVEALRTE
ncbi:MAG: ABC transporter ATP-binding protein/permease [Clostridia bacterium]|nr:ABC transporter ATP-binding protein/permease [Clostridia bacterium]